MNRAVFFAIGFAVGFGAIFYISLIPYTPIELGLIETRPDPNSPMGTELTVFGYRIHHYMLGIGVVGLAVVLTVKRFNTPFVLLLYGFGAALIVDQLPHLIGYCAWDIPCFNDWRTYVS